MPIQTIDILEHIYTAALIPEEWNGVIDRFSAHLNARGGSLFILVDGELYWEAPSATKKIMEDYIAGGWDKNNPRLDGLLARAHPGFVRDSDVCHGDHESLPIVTEFLRPRDIAYTTATVIKGTHDDLAVFSVDRGRAAGSFTQEDIGWLDALRPHLARSIALSSRLRLKQAATATATLSMVGIPAAVIGRNRSVKATNDLFDKLCGTLFLPSAYGGLSLSDPRANLALKEALSPIARSGTKVRSIPLRNADGIVGVLHAVPAYFHARDILGDGGTLIALAQPKDAALIEPEWLRWLYDLSPVEATVAALLARGFTAGDIAVERRTSISSVRSHVKSLLRKTGLTRQTDFVRSIASLAAIEPLTLHR
ncbi:helix-turn-helix transcriptional regulator [Xaviernesmea oryzae]|nr:helix-turn-helix transcriptional regulator [Xaviernesmea oryzae]SEM10428.1 DNA-binding transcriptional regulator, CsgD family [Xaviernesmea oryzae]